MPKSRCRPSRHRHRVVRNPNRCAGASARSFRSSSYRAKPMQTKASSAELNDLEIEPIDRSLEPQFRARIDGKAKPLGSLGRLEDIAVHVGLIWHPLAPPPRGA